MSISVHLVDSSRGTGSTHVEVVSLPLELGGGVHLVGHDASDGLDKMAGQQSLEFCLVVQCLEFCLVVQCNIDFF